MYTISHAAALAGVSVELLRAWERRYGVVTPARTSAGYRLYDDEAVNRLRTMRSLVDAGWSARTAAEAIIAGEAPVAAVALMTTPRAVSSEPDPNAQLIEQFVSAAQRIDASELSRTLDAMLASGSFERVIGELILPAMVRTGEEWAAGHLSVAAEHAASGAVLRRLGIAFEAAGIDPSIDHAIVFALPPGCLHELGLLAFATICRRAGVPTVYVGANLPREDWLSAAATSRGVVIGVPTRADRGTAAKLGAALAEVRPAIVVALGGPAAPAVEGCLTLNPEMLQAAAQLRAALD